MPLIELKDFSHRSPSSKAWLVSNGKPEVSDKWGGGRSWSKIHKSLSSRENSSDWDFDKPEERAEVFLKWVSTISRIPSSPQKISVAYQERPWLKSDGSQVLSSFAATDLRDGDTLLDIPVQLLISDEWVVEDPKGLRGAPWEIRLAAKLLRERSRGNKSKWASYIKLLPTFVPLPIFFSDLEINNIQDSTIVDEVRTIRKYARATYQALDFKDISRAKFSEYAWALSIVYSSACQVDKVATTGRTDSAHYLLPFFGSTFGSRGQVYAKYENRGLKLLSHDVKGGMPLAAEYDASSTMRDIFIFRGFVAKINHQDKFSLFHDIQDAVDWYSSTFGAVNNNRYLTLRIARDAVRTLTAYLSNQETTSLDRSNASEMNFSIGANGFVDHYMTSIFATLSYAKHALTEDMIEGRITSVGLIVKNGTTRWERILQSIATETLSRYRWNMMDCKKHIDSSLEFAFKSAKTTILQRIHTVLQSFSTDLSEDQYLLDAAGWEGLNNVEDEQLACPSCRWQTEQLSFYDYLALQYRLSVKTFLSEMTSAISCEANKTDDMSKLGLGTRPGEGDNGALQRFLGWCAEHDLTISDRLTITDILVPPQDEFSRPAKVRGLVALADIHQGETLSSLPMTVGLFNNDSVSGSSAVDAWDYAAARLLREKVKGNESNWAPYIAILPEYLPTPIHLESRELLEVQWWPVIRELIQVRKAIKESYTKLSPNELSLASYNEYKWAVTMVHSRAFTLPVKPDEQYEQYVFMPFMDMINHHYHYKPVWDGKLEITARRTVKKGEEIFASFGPRTNDNLFLYYGFVLEDNPFDAVPLFGSFEEALRWFVGLWTDNCADFAKNQVKASRCQRKTWQNFWNRMKNPVEEAESGSAAQGRDWGELLNYWADLGFQFLPYQPGPTIYPGGIIDPSFLAVFSSSFEVLETMRKDDGIDSPWSDPCPECGNHSAVGSSAMHKFLACIEKQSSFPRGLLDGPTCQSELTKVVLKEEKLTRAMLLARISVVLRCKEILSSFPTTISEDRDLLKADPDTCSQETSASCQNVQSVSSHLQLTRRYRYMKKLMLQTPVDKLLK
ncbi:hypothetical protein AXG93_4225s1370 [Marchantia polymorpha subsp. ruderalis]|uniref:Uncharacterized protein n=1 Tax=Marchantia polymorpha subsp. ruderalis TaxID=1480154 RepID=A0A176WTF9_MARPO|nr:hypothetical protein AXG93_4225s1370 [Marchantia polymorpha subsp. ruderalis]